MAVKRKVLFVCVGNACRSQMAEGFARSLGGDVMDAESAGLAAALKIPEETHIFMAEKNIDTRDQFPKDLREMDLSRYQLVINMSGYPLPVSVAAEVREWPIQDPIFVSEKKFRAIRDEIEQKVKGLIDETRPRI